MKKMFKEFSDLVANILIMFCFGVAFFLILINLYHSQTISLRYTVNNSQEENYVAFVNTMDRLKTTLGATNYEKLTNSKKVYFTNVGISLKKCVNYITDSAYYKDKGIVDVNTVDVYNDAIYFYYSFYNKCVVNEISNLKDFSKKFNYDEPYFENIDSFTSIIKDQLTISDYYLFGSLLNNSSYSMITTISQRTIFNQVGEGYAMLGKNYQIAARYLDEITSWMFEQTKETR